MSFPIATRDAAGNGQMFEAVPVLTDVREGTNGIALDDLNRDGLLDVVTVTTPPFNRGKRIPRESGDIEVTLPEFQYTF